MASLNKILILIAISLFLLSSSQGVAQHLSGAVGMVNVGLISTNHLRSSAEAEVADSIQFGNMYTLVGAEGYYRNGKAIISLSGYLGIQAAQFKGDKLLEPFFWTAHAGFGWLLTNKSNVCVYPAAGLGVSELSITEHSRYPVSHVEIAKTKKPTADLSLHCDYLILDPGSNGVIVNGIALGAKIGYNFSITSPSQLHGWYFTVSVGGLAFMRKNR